MPTQSDPHARAAGFSVLGPALAGARTAALGAWTIGVAQSALVHGRMLPERSRLALRHPYAPELTQFLRKPSRAERAAHTREERDHAAVA